MLNRKRVKHVKCCQCWNTRKHPKSTITDVALKYYRYSTNTGVWVILFIETEPMRMCKHKHSILVLTPADFEYLSPTWVVQRWHYTCYICANPAVYQMALKIALIRPEWTCMEPFLQRKLVSWHKILALYLGWKLAQHMGQAAISHIQTEIREVGLPLPGLDMLRQRQHVFTDWKSESEEPFNHNCKWLPTVWGRSGVSGFSRRIDSARNPILMTMMTKPPNFVSLYRFWSATTRFRPFKISRSPNRGSVTSGIQLLWKLKACGNVIGAILRVSGCLNLRPGGWGVGRYTSLTVESVSPEACS